VKYLALFIAYFKRKSSIFISSLFCGIVGVVSEQRKVFHVQLLLRNDSTFSMNPSPAHLSAQSSFLQDNTTRKPSSLDHPAA